METWGNRPIEGNHPHVFLDGLWLKRSWGGEVRKVPLLRETSAKNLDLGIRENRHRSVSWTSYERAQVGDHGSVSGCRA
jgi:putative transposase